MAVDARVAPGWQHGGSTGDTLRKTHHFHFDAFFSFCIFLRQVCIQQAAALMPRCGIAEGTPFPLSNSTLYSEYGHQAVVVAAQVADGDALPVRLDTAADAYPAAVRGVAAVHGGGVHDAALARLPRHLYVHHHPLGHKRGGPYYTVTSTATWQTIT